MNKVLANCMGKVWRHPATLRGYSSSVGSEKTPLYQYHLDNKGKIVDFSGYLLPVQYADQGIAASHLHTRKYASVFDVSHMLQTYIRGKDAIECFESICTADIKGLKPNSGTLTVFTNTKGGILDDLIVTKLADNLLYVVSNAGCKPADTQLITETVGSFSKSGKDVAVEFLPTSDQALIAVQGPTAVKALQTICDQDLSNLFFMTSTVATVAGVANCRITRCGYTGEDGVEISIDGTKATHVTEALLNVGDGNVKLAGLGARDSLRLEAGLCLYGSDIDTSTTPIDAGLTWLVAKRRRQEANFPGAEAIVSQIAGGCERKRVGIRMANGPPARHGCAIFVDGTNVGEITSGCPSPSLSGNVAMGYVLDAFKKAGTNVEIDIRNKKYPAQITKMPFVESKYYIKKK